MINPPDYLNDTGSTVGAVASATPIGAAVSIVNNVVNNLFNSGIRKQQQQAIAIQSKINLLSAQEQDQLNQKLAQTTNANDQLQILLTAVGNTQQNAATSTTKSQTTLAIVALAGAIALLVTIYIIKKHH